MNNRSKVLYDLVKQDPVISLSIIGAVAFLFIVPLWFIFGLELPTALEGAKQYFFIVALILGLFCLGVGYWRGWRMPRVGKSDDVPEDIQYIENINCHVLHRVSPQEYSKIAEFHLTNKIGDPYKFKKQPVVFTVFAFEPCEIWRILEREWKKQNNSGNPKVEELVSVAEITFPHFKQFSVFYEKYPQNTIKRAVLLPYDWQSRNSRDHFELLTRLNSDIPCEVAIKGTVAQFTFLTDYALIGNVMLDYYSDSETLVITHLSGRQNPQIPGYLLGFRNYCCGDVKKLESLNEFRTAHNV